MEPEEPIHCSAWLPKKQSQSANGAQRSVEHFSPFVSTIDGGLSPCNALDPTLYKSLHQSEIFEIDRDSLTPNSLIMYNPATSYTLIYPHEI